VERAEREREKKKKTNAAETKLGAPTVEDRDRTMKSSTDVAAESESACDGIEIFKHGGFG